MAIFNSQLLVYQRVVLRCLRALEDLFRRWCPWRNWDFEMSVLSGFGFRVENSPRNPSFLRLKSHSIVVNYIIWLVVWTPLKKYDFVSWGYYSQYMESQNPNVPNHQPVVYIYLSLFGVLKSLLCFKLPRLLKLELPTRDFAAQTRPLRPEPLRGPWGRESVALRDIHLAFPHFCWDHAVGCFLLGISTFFWEQVGCEKYYDGICAIWRFWRISALKMSNSSLT